MAGERVLITGASSGIGAALALELSRAGMRVALSARRRNALESVAKQCREQGAAEAIIVVADVSDPREAARAVKEAESAFDGLDIVVANAGIGGDTPADRLRWDAVESILKTNITGAFATVVAASEGMLARGSGQIIGVSSLASYKGMARSSVYCASKAAFTTFLEGLRPGLAKRGVSVGIVSPGFIATPLTDGRGHPMPFLMDAPCAARIIARGIRRKTRHIAFPWPMLWAVRLLRFVPDALYDRFATLL